MSSTTYAGSSEEWVSGWGEWMGEWMSGWDEWIASSTASGSSDLIQVFF